MIDNQFSKLPPFLKKTALEYDFNIINISNLFEGLEKLKNSPGLIEAVIVVLSNIEGDMPEAEEFSMIKAINNCIPIIILNTDEDGKLVTKLNKWGSDDNFSKLNISPSLLFMQIENAINLSIQRKNHTISSKTEPETPSKTPFFYFTTQNFRISKGYFAYRMDAVCCASFENKFQSDQLCQMASDWHFNFLNTLTFYNSGITLRLRYIYDPAKRYIDTILVTEFDTPLNGESIFKIKEIQREFDLIMKAKKEFSKTVYYFSPITDEDDLNRVLFPFVSQSAIQFTPEFFDYTQSPLRQIGFVTSSGVREEMKVTLPPLLRPDIKLDNFCEHLVCQKTKTMIEIVLVPLQLGNDEVRYIKGLNINSLNFHHYAENEKEKVSQTVAAYLNTPTKCFNVEVFESQESNNIGENLLSAISTAFFESATRVRTSQVNYNQLTITKDKDYTNKQRKWNSLYSLSNICNIFKFPYPFSHSMPGIRLFKPVFGYMPPNISKAGVVAGIKNIGNDEIQIRLGVEDLRKHLYLLGQTGTGKTTVLYSMIMDRIKSGKGVCVIDPHGDLYLKILENLPEERLKDVILFEPGDPANTIRINLLEYNRDNPQEKSFLIDELFNFFRQEYDVNLTMGPMFELYMKNALLLLMDDPDHIGSIGHVSRIFQNAEFRSNLLEKCKDRDVVDFWRETAMRLSGDWSLANFAPYITSKLNQLLINEYVKPIVIARKSNIDFREIIDNDQILLVSLSKGKIGKIGVNILGTVILSRIINAAFSRENIFEEHRKDFTLFIDEFQNFASQSVMYAMSEARKYRLSLILANQTLGQLSESMRQSVLGNVGSTIFFRPGINDVDYIMPYFAPYLTREDVLTLPNFKCIGRLQINNSLSLPFIFDTIPIENAYDNSDNK